MSERDYFAHITPEGLKPGDRAMENGFCHEYVGENLAAGQRTVKAVMQAWDRSPSHQLNMLEAKYVYVGMGHMWIRSPGASTGPRNSPTTCSKQDRARTRRRPGHPGRFLAPDICAVTPERPRG